MLARVSTTERNCPDPVRFCAFQAARVPQSNPDQHERFQKKLTWQDLSRRGRARKGEDAEKNENDEADGDADAGPKASGTKDTPLEKQVVELKKKHPGVLLLIEVGYKYHCYGSDAEVAAQVRVSPRCTSHVSMTRT